MSEYDLAIVGGGPSGLTAAAYAVRAKLNVALIARTLGGKVSYPFALRNLPSTDNVWGAELVRQMEEFVTSSAATIILDVVERIGVNEAGCFDVHLGSGGVVHAKATIVNTGARAKRLYVAGEKQFRGRGVSFSAISHAPFFAGRDVAVVGSGPRAVVAALELASIANQVYLIAPSLRSMAELPLASEVMNHPRVSVFQNWEIQEIVGDEFVSGISLVGANGEIRLLPVDGVCVQFELLPHNDLVRGVVEIDEHGHISIDPHCATSQPGLFAAGDVTGVHAEQVVVSIGEGAKAALSAWEYLATHG